MAGIDKLLIMKAAIPFLNISFFWR